MAEIIMITGGQRSGKSRFAESVALSLSKSPVYVATARVWDEEFRHRVELHKERRGSEWTTYEEPLDIASLPLKHTDVVLLDCITLWATNCFFECGEDVYAAARMMKEQLTDMCDKCKKIIFVTNEIGLGGVAENAMQRRFTDLQGTMNQYIASMASEVHFVISGIDMRVK